MCVASIVVGIELPADDMKHLVVTAGVERFLGRDLRLAVMAEARSWDASRSADARARQRFGHSVAAS